MNNLQTRKLRQFDNVCRLEQIIEGPTRLTPNSETLIDHIHSNSPHVRLSGTLDCNITDHFPVFVVLKKSKTIHQVRNIYARSYREFDRQSFKDDIRGIDLDVVFDNDDPEEIWDRLFAEICCIIDSHCPLRAISITVGRPKYLTESILALMKERDRAYRSARKYNTVDRWQLARTFRARVAKELRVARRNYIFAEIQKADGDGKKFWRTINTEFFNKPTSPITTVFDERTQSLLEGVAQAAYSTQ